MGEAQRRPCRAEKLRGSRERLPFVTPIHEARIHLALGDRETAFRLLNRPYEERDFQFPIVRFEPLFDGVRGDPRIVELLQKAGLPTQ